MENHFNKVSAKNILITGSSTGIGRATAELLSLKGFHVYAGVRKEEDLQILAKIENITPVKLDVTKKTEVNEVFELIRRGSNKLFGLINNAGITRPSPLMDTSEEEFRNHLDINIIGVHRVTKTFFPMILSTRGRIIMVGSFFGVLAFPFSGSYSASKAAFEMYVDTLRRELLTVTNDVKVINIWPGPIKTAVWEKSLAAAKKYNDPSSIFTETFQKIMSITQKPLVEPEEVAQAILKSLTTKKPKIKYSPGMNKFPLRRLRYFPATFVDKFLQRVIKRQIKSSDT